MKSKDKESGVQVRVPPCDTQVFGKRLQGSPRRGRGLSSLLVLNRVETIGQNRMDTF